MDRLLVIQVFAMKTPSLRFAPAACCAFALGVLLSRPTAAEELEQHPPHEHGKVTINAALEGNQLVIEFDSPAINVVGFEHEQGAGSQEAHRDAKPRRRM